MGPHRVTGPRFRIEACAVGCLFRLARIFPRPALLALGTLAGHVAQRVLKRPQAVALRNLRRAYGAAMDERTVRRTLRACWAHFGRTLFDTFHFPYRSRSEVGRLVHYEGLEHIRRAYRRGAGVLLFSGHFGHWELVALMQGFLGMPLALVTRPLDNPYLERLLAKLRTRSGNVIIHHRGAVRGMVRALRRGLGVAIVIDQDARGQGVFVPFFGRLASTTPTLASLALRTGATIVPVFSVPLPDGSYRITYEPAVRVQDTGDREADVLRLTAECTAVIERWVRRHPSLWLWMHDRWKTEPPRLGLGA